MAHMELSPSQSHALESTIRACSTLSMVSSIFVMSTFLGSNFFQTPINRLIFYAAFGNLFINIVMLFGLTPLYQGSESSLCQFQALVVQWFSIADPLWSFCMAFNTYLTLFRRLNTSELKRLEWRYMLLCYGLTFPPALVPAFINTRDRGRVYGPASLYCWITPEWEGLRFALGFGPIWVMTAVILLIFLITGKEILAHQRRMKNQNLRNMSFASGPETDVVLDNYPSHQAGGELSNAAPASSPQWARSWGFKVDKNPNNSRSKINSTRATNNLSIGVGASNDHETTSLPPVLSSIYEPLGAQREEPQPQVASIPNYGNIRSYSNTAEQLCPPSSLEATMPTLSPTTTTNQSRNLRSNSIIHNYIPERHTAAYLYAKASILFFISLLMTWTVPSIARIYQVASKGDSNFGLLYVSGIVLPLQGFWNCVVYVMTSYAAVKVLFMTMYMAVKNKIQGVGVQQNQQQMMAVVTRRAHMEKRMAGETGESRNEAEEIERVVDGVSERFS